MKSRVFVFSLGFMLGLTPGYFLGQERYRTELEAGFVKVAGKVDAKLREWVRAAINKTGQATDETLPPPPPAKLPAKESLADTGAYVREFVALREIQARRDSGATKQVVVSGTVKNSGSRRLQTVEVIVFFVGNEGIIHEAKAAAVQDKPLDAQDERSFSIQVLDVPAQWNEGKIRVAVTDVTFAP